MSHLDPYELLFGGMEKLGPGSDEDTRRVLNTLPKKEFQLVVDAGCGSGRQTLVLAEALGVEIHAVDTYEIFLKDLSARAKKRNVGHLVKPHQMDMADIPKTFHDIDLLWSEGSAYNIGFDNALERWAKAIKTAGFLVVSELSWVKEDVPPPVRDFFKSEYPAMRLFQENIETTKKLGYKLLDTYALPERVWVDGFYDVLKPRAKSLVNHADESVRKLASEMLKEIEVFENSQGSFAYYFFVLQR